MLGIHSLNHTEDYRDILARPELILSNDAEVLARVRIVIAAPGEEFDPGLDPPERIANLVGQAAREAGVNVDAPA